MVGPLVRFIIPCLLCLPWLTHSAERPHRLAQDRPPNIVFIFADDLGFGDLGSYGHPYARTPALDKLGSEGTRFEQFYVTGVTCCPSRTGFMTSRHPASFPKYMSGHGFAGRATVTELLKKRGYRTGHFGKWHIGPDSSDGTYGIDEIDVMGGNKKSKGGRDVGLFEAATGFIERNKDRPFYVNIWGHITHFPVGPVQSLVDEFKDVKVSRADFGYHQQKTFDEAEAFGGDLNVGMRNYLGDVYSLDLQVGRLLAKIDALGLRENTIVVFSSDHGPAPVKLGSGKNDAPARKKYAVNMLGYAGGLRGGKHNQFEGGVRSPFIVRWPGKVPAGRVNKTSVFSGLDWLPTLCHIAGAKIDAKALKLEGENVVDIWLGSDRSRNDPLFWKTSAPGAKPAMREGKWKLHAGNRQLRNASLYDLSVDPEERSDVAAKHPGVMKQMTAKLAKWNATLPKEYDKSGGR